MREWTRQNRWRAPRRSRAHGIGRPTAQEEASPCRVSRATGGRPGGDASSVWATNRRSGARCRKLPNTMSGALRLCWDGTVRPSQNSAADAAGEGHHRRLTPPLVAGRHPGDAGGIGIAFGDVHRAQRRERLVGRQPVVEGHVQHRMTLIDGVQPERAEPPRANLRRNARVSGSKAISLSATKGRVPTSTGPTRNELP